MNGFKEAAKRSKVRRRRILAAGSVAGLLLGLLFAPGVADATPGHGQGMGATQHVCAEHPAAGKSSCYAIVQTDFGVKTRDQVVASRIAPSGWGAQDLQSAYNLPSAALGGGQRVYIVDAGDDPTAEADLGVYRTQYGLPACTTANGCFQKLNQSGATSPLPATDTGWSTETALDLDMVSASCPNCSITLVESNSESNDDLFATVKKAGDLGGKFVSISFGPYGDCCSAYDADFQTQGIAYLVAAGDTGYGLAYPNIIPTVVSVGGTVLARDTSARGWNETVWNGTNSGCSTSRTKPSWQSIISNSVCSKRADNDIAAVASGLAVYNTTGKGGWIVVGGTSASAPLVAGMYAMAGTPAATDQPVSWPYAHANHLYDITSGNNGTCTTSVLCTAGTGWDGPTGLGSPNGVAALTSANHDITVTNPGSQTSIAGTSVSLQVQASEPAGSPLTYTATGLPPGLSINASTGQISGTVTTGGTYSVAVTVTDPLNSSGSATFTWQVNAPMVSVAPSSIAFGTVPRGTSSMQSITVTNPGNADLHASSVSISGDSSFSTSVSAFTLPAGSTQMIPVAFAPPAGATSAGPLNATLTILSDAVNNRSVAVPLSGTVGIPVASLSSTSVDFGNAAVGSPVTKTVTVTNSGTAPLSVTGLPSSGTNAGDFSASGCAAVVAPTASCDLTLRFAPSAGGVRSGTISVVSNGLVSPIPITVKGSAFYLHGSAYGVMVNANGGVAALLPFLFNQHLAPTPSVTAATSGSSVSGSVAHAYDNPYTDVYNLTVGAITTGGTSLGSTTTATTGATNIFDDIFAQGTAASCSATPTGVTGNATITGLRVDGVTYGGLGWPFRPNDYLFTANGGKLVINEQIHNADGTLTINALHLYINNPTYGNSGDVIVGHVNCGINTTP